MMKKVIFLGIVLFTLNAGLYSQNLGSGQMKLDFTADLTLGKGFDKIETYQVGGVDFLFCHNIQSGVSKIWNLDIGGNPVFERKTFSGWTSFVFFKLDGNTYLFEFKKESGHHNVYVMNEDGSIGDTVKDKEKWSAGWTDFDVMYDDNDEPSIIMMNASNGRAKFFKPSF